MKKVIRLSESDITNLVKKVLNEQKSERYMFFSNLEQMRRQCDLLLNFDRSEVESILDNGHDWAQDHISEAKNNMDQVFDFMMNETTRDDMGSSMDMDALSCGSFTPILSYTMVGLGTCFFWWSK